jgi:hypothetical protein
MKNAKFHLAVITLILCSFSSIDKARKGKINIEIAAASVKYPAVL